MSNECLFTMNQVLNLQLTERSTRTNNLDLCDPPITCLALEENISTVPETIRVVILIVGAVDHFNRGVIKYDYHCITG